MKQTGLAGVASRKGEPMSIRSDRAGSGKKNGDKEGAGTVNPRPSHNRVDSTTQAGAVPVPNASNVGIFRTTSGISTYRWLCPKCVTTLEAEGWACERIGDVSFECDEICQQERKRR